MVRLSNKCYAMVRHMARTSPEKSFLVLSVWEAVDEAEITKTILARIKVRTAAMDDDELKRSLLRAVLQKRLDKAQRLWAQAYPNERFDIYRTPWR
jgi:hypothetical protein